VAEIDPISNENPTTETARVNLFGPADVIAILQEKNWLTGEPNEQQIAWCARAAVLLGVQAADRARLADLLQLVFHYDAHGILNSTEAHVVMSRYAARNVLRHLALLLLDCTELNTDRFREIVDKLKLDLDIRGRELFHPLRLALAGHAGEGELDRVILLLDEAAAARFIAPVKTARERILEFCSVFD